jgi:hypothetical protein
MPQKRYIREAARKRSSIPLLALENGTKEKRKIP